MYVLWSEKTAATVQPQPVRFLAIRNLKLNMLQIMQVIVSIVIRLFQRSCALKCLTSCRCYFYAVLSGFALSTSESASCRHRFPIILCRIVCLNRCGSFSVINPLRIDSKQRKFVCFYNCLFCWPT